ncbi:MAG: outer membrane beta-barrel domain-containing protein [Rhizobacter sp.]|nr:outer membrane beta-barrel domain-containing protein [Rhizobacter sp.]
MQTKPFAHALLTALTLAVPLLGMPSLAAAADTPQDEKPANEQVIVPQVDRRDVKPPKFPSNDIEMGLFVGTYATQNFGTSTVSGLRLGYHITEDFFVEGAYGRTKVTDEAYSATLPAPILASHEEKLVYYNISAGVNVLPGEVFLGRNYAKASALYLIGGVGSTKFNKQRKQTFNVGFGMRVFLKDWAALQLDMRDHIFELDLLGKRDRTQNLEMTMGATFFF